MASAAWLRCNQTRKCPICGRAKGCGVAADKPEEIVNCLHTEPTECPPGWSFMHGSELGGGVYCRGELKRAKREGPDWDALHKTFRQALTGDRLQRLADALGLPADAVRELQPGWCAEFEGKHKTYRGVWTWPVREASGRIIGFAVRDQDGAKWMLDGSKPGLFIPDGFFKLPDPVLLVEGASNVAACRAVGLTALGRPSNNAGADPISDITRLCDSREVIVMGDFDPNPDRLMWPGMTGAVNTAGKLAMRWGDAVAYAMPPDREKDVRDWIKLQLERGQQPAQVGQTMLDSIRLRAKKTTGAGSARTGERELIANVMDEVKGGKQVEVVIPLPHIAAHMNKLTDGWPRRVNGHLFFESTFKPENGIATRDSWYLCTKPETLFAFMQQRFDVRWEGEEAIDSFTGDPRNPTTKGEFFAHLKETAMPNYSAVELLPHHPPLPDVHYLTDPENLPKSDGTALDELVNHLNPATEMDRHLLRAAIVTMAWGGPPGRRPSFVLTSDFGRGAGKTRTALLLGQIFGGAVLVGENEDWERVRTRLLSDESLRKRCIIIDNVRGKLARSGLEAAITTDIIDGHRLFVGQFSRPNLFTWIITSNAPALTKDLADRSVIIKIGKPKHGEDFEKWLDEFMGKRRAEVIADCIRWLQRGKVATVPPELRDRWGAWIEGVLSTFENAVELLAYIKEGRPAVDQDLKDAEEVAYVIEAIVRKIERAESDPADLAIRDYARITISKPDMRAWLVAQGVIDHKLSVKAVTSFLNTLKNVGPMVNFSESPGRANGRRWLWSGPLARVTEAVDYDPQQHGAPTGEYAHTLQPRGAAYRDHEQQASAAPTQQRHEVQGHLAEVRPGAHTISKDAPPPDQYEPDEDGGLPV